MNRALRRATLATIRPAERFLPFSPGPLPPGSTRGWLGQVDRTWQNGWFAVLGRVVGTPDGPVLHLAIRNVAESDIPWADKMWIKDQIAGPERTAVEVFPARAELVDGAMMYHIWCYPPGHRLPFGIAAEECAA